MADSPRYALQLLANNAGNVQRVNEALLIAEAFLGGALVLERDRLVEPVGPAEGDMYLLPASGSLSGTDWATFTNGNFALFVNAAWLEVVVDAGLEGCKVHVQEDRADLTYHGATNGWQEAGFSVSAGLSAAGTTQGAGTVIASRLSEFTTVTAASAEAATLPAAIPGAHYVVRNAGASTLKLFPASGDAIDTASVDASVDVLADATASLWASSTGQWYSLS